MTIAPTGKFNIPPAADFAERQRQQLELVHQNHLDRMRTHCDLMARNASNRMRSGCDNFSYVADLKEDELETLACMMTMLLDRHGYAAQYRIHIPDPLDYASSVRFTVLNHVGYFDPQPKD
jgi:hypothetical protein